MSDSSEVRNSLVFFFLGGGVWNFTVVMLMKGVLAQQKLYKIVANVWVTYLYITFST